MEFSQHSRYARFPRTRLGTTATSHRSTTRQALKYATKQRILSAALLASAAGAMLGVSALHAAESYWPGTQRKFAPSIWVGGFNPKWSVSQIDNHWNTWARPYYADWIDPSRGEKMGLWYAAAGLTVFYNNKNRAPANPKDPNDPNYNWEFIDRALASDAVRRDGATINIRIDLEGSGMFPSWFKALGYTKIPAKKPKDVLNWGNPAAVRALKDFITAFARRYNSNENFYTIAFPEQGRQTAAENSAKVDFFNHTLKEFDRTMLVVFQNAGVENSFRGVPGIGWGNADPKPFFNTCGSSGKNYGDNGKPLCDCGTSGTYGRSQHYASVAGLPSCSGAGALTVVSSEHNGFKFAGNSGSTPNPWGERLPTGREMLPESNLTPAIFAWYHGYKPRGNKRSSRLGFNGAEDPAGIVPANVLIMATKVKGARPADWDRAFSTFGKAGTNAILWPPANFSPASKRGSNPQPDPEPQTPPDPIAYIPKPAPVPQSCSVVPAPGQTLFNACYNALGYTKPFTAQEKLAIKACSAACENPDVISQPDPEPQPVPQPETDPQPTAEFGTPENFNYTAVRRRSVNLSWDDVNGERGYTIQWRRGSRGRWRNLTVGSDTTQFTHRNLRRRSTYNYRICANRPSRQGGSSDWSEIISVRTR